MHEAPTGLMTVEQFAKCRSLSRSIANCITGVSWPNFGDTLVRSRIGRELDAALDGHGIVMTRLPFRALANTSFASPMSAT
jgi:hypothetical protein